MTAISSSIDTLFEEKTVVGRPVTTPTPVRRAVLVVLEGEDIGRIHILDRDTTTVGRGQDCDILLQDASVSRKHVSLFRHEGEALDATWVEDHGSTNGTFVNSERITGPRRLAEHDRLRIGTTLYGYRLRDDLELDAERRLIQLATVEPLTGLMNRGAFDQALEREFDRAVRYGRPLSLILLDLDHFKTVNDTFGHPVGDRVLAQVALAIRGAIRQVDMAGRYGGEEFAVLLTETGHDGAATAGDRIRHAISALAMAVGDTPVHVTASVGVVTWNTSFQTCAELVEAADRSLYRAKHGGRNRTIITRA